LGQSGDAGQVVVDAPFVALGKQLGLVKQIGSGAHQAHVALGDVDKLRQLIQFGFAQKVPKLGNGSMISQMRGYRLGVLAHGAEFNQPERLFILPHPFLNKKRTSCIKKSYDIKHQSNGPNNQQPRN